VPVQQEPDADPLQQSDPVEVAQAVREHWSDEHDLALADAGSAPAIETSRARALAVTGIEVGAADAFTAHGFEQESAPAADTEPDPARSEFDDKRTEWRARFRAALTTRKESDRGND